MQIKQQMLAQQVQKNIAPLYILIGQDNYLLDESLSIIKTAIKKSYVFDEKILSVQNADDWNILIEEANSYSLFSDTVLINLYYDKKSIDAAGKKALMAYLDAINPKCFIIIRAPNIPAKQLQWLNAYEHAIISVAYPMSAMAIKIWISTQLKNNKFRFDPLVPDLIQQYTQGNMLACAQIIEKISLCNNPGSVISVREAQEHLFDQCNLELFELTEACLLGQGAKAIQILRHAAHNKTEPTLVLWLLTQETRNLMQLSHYIQRGIEIKNACNQLKIWPQRINLYQLCCKRFALSEKVSVERLRQLHRHCYTIDECIKSNFNNKVWNALENLALSLCLGQLIGDTCFI